MNLVLIKFLNSQYPWLRLALPRAQVCTRDALFFDPAVLSRNRVGKSGFKFFLRSQTGVVLVGVQSAKVIDQWDDGVNLPFFLCKHRFPLGEYANAFNTVFGFGGGAAGWAPDEWLFCKMRPRCGNLWVRPDDV